MSLRLVFVCIIIFTNPWSQGLIAVPSATLFTQNEWSEIAPYLLPDSHPVKSVLDRIFSGERAIRTQETLKDAGFHVITKGHWSDTVIATHSKADGYIFKLFTEDQAHIHEVSRLLSRIKGALYAQSIVSQHGWNKLFKIPRKWLYLVPEDPNPTWGISSKHVVLIAEDMRLLKKHDSYKKWKQSNLNKTLFKAVFQVLTEGGFSDSSFAFNLPFAKDGRIALIDNDKFDKRPIQFSNLFKYLHSDLKKYGEKLIQEAGPAVAF